jgi:hypothetical protein
MASGMPAHALVKVGAQRSRRGVADKRELEPVRSGVLRTHTTQHAESASRLLAISPDCLLIQFVCRNECVVTFLDDFHFVGFDG